MKQMLTVVLLALALTACNEEEDTSSDTATSVTTESSQSAAPAENTATADDGGGAMDGASTENTATADDGGGAMDGASDTGGAGVNISEVSQDAIDACIDAVRATNGAVGGTVTGTEFSEANSLVMLQDANGGEWRCLVSNDGSNATAEQINAAASGEDTTAADDGGGALDGANSETVSPVGSPTDLSAFVGARGGQAEGGLRALGFEAIRSEGLTTFWFNREVGACAKITTSDGVFSEIIMVPAEDC
ncbi:hypothetical protein [Aestuariivita boseongensis]|uniref:hypothetical protein n=1 Tax=Aestuariivita boseongensis TaxID=1470562 RepID=UPI001FDF86A2|nr:hypothetical protein [Aestuariivita boseongensis]